MGFSVIGHGVRRHDNGRVGLVDGVGDCGAGDIVVVGSSGEAPVIAGVRSGVRVGRVECHRTDGGTRFSVHTSD